MEIEPADSREEKTLYRCERFELEDNRIYVEWLWLSHADMEEYVTDSSYETFREATSEEVDLYEEAYADGYGVAAMLEFEHSYDGITFRVELDKDGSLDFEGTKMFECAVCGSHKDFDEEVATVNDLFLGVLKDDKLWHVCFNCAMIGTEIGSIEIEDDESR